MSLLRSVEPEWLDQMAVDDHRAIRTRRDLKRLNTLMLQPGIMAAALAANWQHDPPKTMLDLGTGDGTFMLRVARRLVRRWPGVRLSLLDRQSVVSGETRAAFAALGWQAEPVAADVLDHLERGGLSGIDIVTANLFLHHLEEQPLRRVLELVARSQVRLLVACEPRRNPFTLRLCRILWLLGCNAVTVHDAVASVRAGFRRQELSGLWPDRAGWDCEEYPSRLVTHCMVARRR